MAKITTPVNGAANFPANENEFYSMVETLAVQDIKNVVSTNRIEDGFFYYDLTEDNGVTIEQALIDVATGQNVNKAQCIKEFKDPSLVVRYFNNWVLEKYGVTIRRDDIRKVLIKGRSVEEMQAKIVDTTTQGRDRADFKNGRNLILNTAFPDYSTTLGGTPANMNGVLYALRDMYNTIRTENTLFSTTGFEMGVKEDDIRVAVSDKLLNLIDVTALANIFNLSKVELMGKLVVIPVSDLDKSKWYKAVVYDRHALIHGRRVEYMDSEKCVNNGGSVTFWLFDESLWAYSPLFKAAQLDLTAVANAELAKLITPAA